MNLGTRETAIPGLTLLLGSDTGVRASGGGIVLPPDTAAWVRG
jgi:hypothetical protein